LELNHFNHEYTGGSPDIPKSVGDRYYGQDMARDFWFLYSVPAYLLKQMYKTFPALLKDSYITKGTLYTDLNIPVALGIVEKDVSVPDDFSSIPPTAKTVSAVVMVESAAEADFDISATATLNGIATNYVKLSYAETDGGTRNRAKKAGSYAYEKEPDYLITVNTTAPTTAEVVLAEIIGDGATFLSIKRKTRTPQLNDPYDYVIRTQSDFNQAINRFSANTYKFNEDLKSIKVMDLVGGYSATNFLESGDTYASTLDTNNCIKIDFDPDAYITDQNTRIIFSFVTANGVYNNIKIKGSGGAASVCPYSFYISNDYITLNNCKAVDRKSSVAFAVFYANPTYEKTTSLNGCAVINCQSSNSLYCFKGIYNLSNCKASDIITGNDFYGAYECYNISLFKIYNISSGGGSQVCGMYGCRTISSCDIQKIDVTGGAPILYGFRSCANISNCYIADLDNNFNSIHAVSYCNEVSSVKVYDLDSTGASIWGFDSCYQISACTLENITTLGGAIYGFDSSRRIASCHAKNLTGTGGPVYGFAACFHLSSCMAEGIYSGSNDAYGFSSCSNLTCCSVDGIAHTGSVAGMSAYGFKGCTLISSCYAAGIATNGAGGIANGFNICSYIAATVTLMAANAGNTYVDTDDASVAIKVSTPNSTDNKWT